VERLGTDLPPVQCDANQIQQVILVLMVNASEAMPKADGWRSNVIRSRTEQGLVRVKDSGSGIPPDVLPHIFDPFFTTKEDVNRTGLVAGGGAGHPGAALRGNHGEFQTGRRNRVCNRGADPGGGGRGGEQVKTPIWYILVPSWWTSGSMGAGRRADGSQRVYSLRKRLTRRFQRIGSTVGECAGYAHIVKRVYQQKCGLISGPGLG